MERAFSGDPISPDCFVIEIYLTELRQLFNAIDPSPFRARDLDPKAEEFIVSWSKEAPSDVKLALLVYLARPAGLPDEAAILKDAIKEFFTQRGNAIRQRLRDLFRRGRISLLIGVSFVVVATFIADYVSKHVASTNLQGVIRESFLIGGWVAMWRPLEIFLYDWWPIRSEARMSDRLAEMPVKIVYRNEASPESWQSDWPATAPVTPKQKAPPASERK